MAIPTNKSSPALSSFGTGTVGAFNFGPTSFGQAQTPISFSAGAGASGVSQSGVLSFGSPNSAGLAATKPSTGFGFGFTPSSTAAQPSSTTGFGFSAPASTVAQPSSGAGFGFGNSLPTAQPSGFGTNTSGQPAFGFGSTGSSSLAFGSSANPAGSIAATTPAIGGFGFGQSANNAGSFSFSAPNALGNVALGQPFPQLDFDGATRIHDIETAYAPLIDTTTGRAVPAQANNRPANSNESDCRFDTIMYNRRVPGVPSYNQQQSRKGARWEIAERDNPDPANLEPVRELGIESLKKRFLTLNEESGKYSAHSENLRGMVEAVDKSTKQTALRLEAMRAKHIVLYNRMLSVIRSVEVLRSRGIPVDNEERRYRETLERLNAAMRGPHVQLQELMSVQREHQVEVYEEKIAEDDLETICAVLKKEREGLEHLTDTIKTDIRNINIIKQKTSRPMESMR